MCLKTKLKGFEPHTEVANQQWHKQQLRHTEHLIENNKRHLPIYNSDSPYSAVAKD